jgi:hypothetical protein
MTSYNGHESEFGEGSAFYDERVEVRGRGWRLEMKRATKVNFVLLARSGDEAVHWQVLYVYFMGGASRLALAKMTNLTRRPSSRRISRLLSSPCYHSCCGSGLVRNMRRVVGVLR